MAVPRQEYLDFVALVNPNGETLRDAIWGHLFPENINTRDPTLYEFKVTVSLNLSDYSLLVLGLSVDPRAIVAIFR